MNKKSIITQINEKCSNNLGKVKNFVYGLFEYNTNYERVGNVHYHNNNLLDKSYLEPKPKFSTLVYHISSLPTSLTKNIQETYSAVSQQLNSVSNILSNIKTRKNCESELTYSDIQAIQSACKFIYSPHSYDESDYIKVLGFLDRANIDKRSLKRKLESKWHKNYQQNSIQVKQKKQIEKSIFQRLISTYHVLSNQIEKNCKSKLTSLDQIAVEYAFELIYSNSSSYTNSDYISALNLLDRANINDNSLREELRSKYDKRHNNNLLENSYHESIPKFSPLLEYVSFISTSLTENIKEAYAVVSKQLNNVSQIFSDLKNSKTNLINSNQNNLTKDFYNAQQALKHYHKHQKNSEQLKQEKNRLLKYNTYTTFDIEENIPFRIDDFSPLSPGVQKTTPYQHAIQSAYDLLRSKSSSYDNFQYILTLNILSIFKSKAARDVKSKVAFQWHKYQLKKQFNIRPIIKKKVNKISSRFNYPLSQLPIKKKSIFHSHLTSSTFDIEENIPFQIEKSIAYSPILEKLKSYQHAIQYAYDLLQSKSSSYNDSHYILALDKLEKANITNETLALKLALKCKDIDITMKYLLRTAEENCTDAISSSSISLEQAKKLAQALSKVQKYNTQSSDLNTIYIDKKNHIKHDESNYRDLTTHILYQSMLFNLNNASNQSQYNITLKQSMELLLNLSSDFFTNPKCSLSRFLGIGMRLELSKNNKYSSQDTLLKQYTSLLIDINKADLGFCPSKYIEKVDIITQILHGYAIDDEKIVNTIKQSLKPLYAEYKNLSGSKKNRFKYTNHLLDAASSYMLDKNSLLSKAYQQLKQT